jgi:hypothetical protein
MPPLVLWAWDRDDDFSFIDNRDTAVAYLAATLTLRGESVFLTPRHNPLSPPKGTRLVAVAHVALLTERPRTGQRISMQNPYTTLGACETSVRWRRR